MDKVLVAMPRYERYKDSGVEWLGEVPEHWQLMRAKYRFILQRGHDLSSDQMIDGEYEVYGSNGPIGTHNKYTTVGPGVTVGRSGSVGEVNYVPHNFWAHNTSLYVKNFLNAPQKYVYYLLLALDPKRLSEGSAVSTLDRNNIHSEVIATPPNQEAIRIAKYLDGKTTLISQTIEVKEKQIALLKERKQILIQNAVTRGLDPAVPMKDSGVDWIGEIPVYWEVKRAKYLFNEIDERSKDGLEELLSVSHMTGVTPRSEKNVTMFMAEDYTGSKTCQKDDLVINIMWAWMGAMGVSDQAGIVSSSYGIFRQKETGAFHPAYLEHLLKTTGYIEHYNRVSTGLHSSRLRFYAHMFFDMELGYPDRAEQERIMCHIETESTKINKAITLHQQQIERLKEYKATLINSAVTGKIKVA
ncbi:restriction endonuclease subunit S [Endozoicomonas sp. ONNA2]|uniref:restriction endonuclease subunit S n=1 Tax=Endozoicomonas sp. ONNA2 TaxID=2828741 RepID=UPI002148CDD8|nr:restriction endonuclease subunit S [Endozoicomonas sp. ONNA2]